MKKFLVTVCIILGLGISQSIAQVTNNAENLSDGIQWNGVSTNADGSDITDLGGYRIYIGTDSDFNNATLLVDIPATNSTGDLTPQVYEWDPYPFSGPLTTNRVWVTAYDQIGNESTPSVPYLLIYDDLPPAQPMQVIIQPVDGGVALLIQGIPSDVSDMSIEVASDLSADWMQKANVAFFRGSHTSLPPIPE